MEIFFTIPLKKPETTYFAKHVEDLETLSLQSNDDTNSLWADRTIKGDLILNISADVGITMQIFNLH